MQIYPVDEFYIEILDKKFQGIELNTFESNRYKTFEIDIEKKAINDASIIKNLLAERDAIACAIASLESKMFSIENKVEKIEYDLKLMLESKDIKKIKTPYFNISIALNNPGTNIYDEKSIPMDYVKQSVVQKIDKVQILKDLKNGVIIPGVELQQRTRLEIK